jgi:hypothetical protein
MEILLEGQQINHPVYGLGRITEADEERTTVHFDGHGTKKFVTSLMQAEVLGMAPKRRRGRPRKNPVVATAAAVSAPAVSAPVNGNGAGKATRKRGR